MKDYKTRKAEPPTIDTDMQHLMGRLEEAIPQVDLMVIFPQHFRIYLTIFLVTFHRHQDLKKPRIEVLT